MLASNPARKVQRFAFCNRNDRRTLMKLEMWTRSESYLFIENVLK